MLAALRRVWHRFKTGEVVTDGTRRLYLEGRDTFLYREDDRSVLVQTEMLMGPVDTLVYAGALKHWRPPHQSEPITQEKREEIVRMVCGFLASGGGKVEVDWGSEDSGMGA